MRYTIVEKKTGVEVELDAPSQEAVQKWMNDYLKDPSKWEIRYGWSEASEAFYGPEEE